LRLAAVALLSAVVLTGAGCQQPSTSVSPATTEVDHAAEARKAFERQDWGTAAPHFRLALEKSPGDLSLHYGLAICASWLDIHDEAIREFQWVVDHAAAGSEEARVAREWLAGASGRAVASTHPGAADAVKDERVGDSGVHGRIVWNEGQGVEPLKRFQVHLYAIGEDGASKPMTFHVRTDREGNYRFSKIPSGIYKLTDTNVVTPRWRLKIEVRQGEDALIDLGPENSLNVRDDFPKSS
jgi:hypothetical protein